MRKYEVELQDEEKACGAYCIAMILKYYGFKEEMKVIKEKARLNQNGISIKGMIECFKDYQIEAKAYELSLENFHQDIKLPCILFMVYEGIGHYVVLYEINNDEYVIGDPARGLITIYQEEMQQHYASRVILIHHIGRVPELTYKPYSLFLKETFYSYQKQMISFIMKGFMISLLGYLSSYFFQFMIDDIHIDTKFFYIIILCIAYSFTEIMKTSIERQKNKQVISLQKAIDEDDVFRSSMNMLQLPFQFFQQDKGYIQSQLLSLYDLSEMSIACFERLFLDGISFVIFMLGMLVIHVKMFMVTCIMIILISFITYRHLQKLQDINKNYLESHFVYQHHLLELIENHFLIRRFSLLQRMKEKSYHVFMNEADYKEKQGLYMNHMQSMIQYIVSIAYGVIMLIGFYEFIHTYITLGQLLMFYMLMSYCIQPVMNIVSLVSQYKQVELIYEKYKLFEKPEEAVKEQIHAPITSITLDNVSYAYGYQSPLFEHIDLHIDKHLLLQGNTGSGKSTLLRLFMGYDLHYTGDIYFNDQELRTLDLNSIYQHIGYTNETPSFLHASLKDNFLCTDDKKIEKYLKAFRQSELLEMLHIVLSEDGSPLSLGQRQVVAMIRMLCQEYDVLILDEAFSHMDMTLARLIIRHLLKNDENKIYIMVNHQTKLVNKSFDCAIIEKGKLKSER